MAKELYFYIIKKFFFTFALVLISTVLLLAMINLFDLLDKISGKEIGIGEVIALDILQVPVFIEDISIFLVMLASMITLFSLSMRSEITVMRASGLSFWQILTPIALGAFLLGVVFVLVFNPISIAASKKFSLMEQKLIEKEETSLLSPPGGIWIRQQNTTNLDEDIIIRADKIYRKNLQMGNVSLWFFDKDQKFYQKIDAKTMFLRDGYWYLWHTIINDAEHINQRQENVRIATNLKAEFIAKKILNNFENVRLFSVYDLPSLIGELKDSGFSPRKFVVYYHSLLAKPFLFMAIALIAAFFAINNVRGKNNIMIFVFGIGFGLVSYISLIIINSLGASGLIPTFLSTWMVAIILLAISVLLIFRKEVIY
ncbi:MAG: putative permease [Rickettsiaceae bacterium]|jgi:lipopolysaccharide export system permease protein|nr:putative permease [Rickettsiaceae bacterium]